MNFSQEVNKLDESRDFYIVLTAFTEKQFMYNVKKQNNNIEVPDTFLINVYLFVV